MRESLKIGLGGGGFLVGGMYTSLFLFLLLTLDRGDFDGDKISLN